MSSTTNEEIVLRPYNGGWPARYEREKALIADAMGEALIAIEHIGSTAVPGLEAKPIIDVAIRIDSLAAIPGVSRSLVGIGYKDCGEFGLSGRHFFTKGEPRAVHVHVVDSATDHWERWLAFRDALRSDPATAANYSELKRELVEKFSKERLKYTDGKTDFITGILRKVLPGSPPPGEVISHQ